MPNYQASRVSTTPTRLFLWLPIGFIEQGEVFVQVAVRGLQPEYGTKTSVTNNELMSIE